MKNAGNNLDQLEKDERVRAATKLASKEKSLAPKRNAVSTQRPAI